MSAPDTTTERRPATMTWRQRWSIALLLVPLFMTALDMTILFLALPEIAAALRPSATAQLWVLHVGDLVSVALVLTAGWLTNRLGPRRLLTLGLLAYAAASLLAAFAPSVGVLVLARGLLGAAAVTVMPATIALMRHLLGDGRQFATAMGLTMAAFSGGMALGPPIGGVLLDGFWWGAVFLVNVPVALAVAAGLRLLPAVAGEAAGRLDAASVPLSLGAVASTVYGMQELAAGGSLLTHGPLVAAGALLGVAFVRRQRLLEHPLLPLDAFRVRAFTLSLAGVLLIILATVGAEMQLAQHLQVVLGFSSSQAGLALVVPAGTAVLGTALAPRLLGWLTPSQVMGGGAVLAAAGALVVVTTATSLDGRAGVVAAVAGSTLVELGAAPTFGLGLGLITASVPAARVGSAAAMQEVSGGLGNTLGLALGGSVALMVYQASLRLPAGLDAGQVAAAEGSVGGARSAAEGAVPAVATQVADAAAAAFAASTQALYLFAAALLVVLAVVMLRGLRDARLGDD